MWLKYFPTTSLLEKYWRSFFNAVSRSFALILQAATRENQTHTIFRAWKIKWKKETNTHHTVKTKCQSRRFIYYSPQYLNLVWQVQMSRSHSHRICMKLQLQLIYLKKKKTKKYQQFCIKSHSYNEDPFERFFLLYYLFCYPFKFYEPHFWCLYLTKKENLYSFIIVPSLYVYKNLHYSMC